MRRKPCKCPALTWRLTDWFHRPENMATSPTTYCSNEMAARYGRLSCRLFPCLIDTFIGPSPKNLLLFYCLFGEDDASLFIGRIADAVVPCRSQSGAHQFRHPFKMLTILLHSSPLFRCSTRHCRFLLVPSFIFILPHPFHHHPPPTY